MKEKEYGVSALAEQISIAGLSGAFFEVISWPLLKIWIEQHESNVSFIRASLNIHENSGMRGFAKGLSTIGMGTALSSGFYFVGNQSAGYLCRHNEFLDKSCNQYSFLPAVIKGFTAQFLSMLIHEPTMVVAQMRHASPQLTFAGVIKGVLRENSVFSIYRAALPGFAVGVVADAMGYWFYERTKTYCSQDTKEKAWMEFSHYFFAFACAMVFGTPLDVVATRLRFSLSSDKAIANTFSEKTIPSVIKKVYQTSGCRGFWRGFPATALHAGAVILMVPTVEKVVSTDKRVAV